ncbi:MAG: HAD hydrolase family protein, partial [Erysipelotrichaceae bacterium]|nr:HAD hydrolase family protein [Erysipelotrichaceae bacterium]
MKLITLDLDGTLLNEDGNCTDYAFDVLVRARNKGMIIILNSGRPYYAMNQKILDLPYDYISTCNG